MKTNDKNTTYQALMDMDKIKQSIKEESQNTLKTMLTEAVKTAIRESVDSEDEKEDEDEYEIIDGNKKSECKDKSCKKKGCSKKEVSETNDAEQEQMSQQAMEQQQMPQAQEGEIQDGQDMQGMEQMPQQPQGNEGMNAQGGDEWAQFDQYKVGDNEYDFTGEQDYNNIVKVYKLMNADDNIVVKKDNGTLQLNDNGTGAEYIIELGDEEEPMGGEGEEMPQGELNEEFEFEFDDESDDASENDVIEPEHEMSDDEMQNSLEGKDNEWNREGSEFEVDFKEPKKFKDVNAEELLKDWDKFDDEDDRPAGFDDDFDLFENKKNRKNMKESKSGKKNEYLLEVDLGYTDNYQKKDPIKGLSNNEPSKGRNFDDGAPKGTAKPWAGETKSKGNPFSKTVKVEGSVNEEEMDECGYNEEMVDEANLSTSKWNDTHAVHNRIPAASDDNYRRANKQKTSKGTEYRATENALNEKLEKLVKENKALKKCISEMKGNIMEAYVTNVNLGKIAKLFVENTTSKNEKIDIVNRFSKEAKTIEDSKKLYESISKELKKAKKQITLDENKNGFKSETNKTINENKVYRSKDLLDTIDLMNRVNNC